MKLEYDFGFSLVSESQLKEKETELEQQLAETSLTQQQKLEKLRDMIMVLLKQLLQSPEKSYIFWPQRQDKIQAFIKQIDELVK